MHQEKIAYTRVVSSVVHVAQSHRAPILPQQVGQRDDDDDDDHDEGEEEESYCYSSLMMMMMIVVVLVAVESNWDRNDPPKW